MKLFRKSKYAWYQPSYGGMTHYFRLFGVDLELRIASEDFQNDVKRIVGFLDDKSFGLARYALDQVYRKWGNDIELIRLEDLLEDEERAVLETSL
jgi:hypothetical protein